MGIKLIHNNNIVHRDLKPENIFIDINNKIKIGDFGLSRNFNSYKAYTLTPNGAGTTQYNAPEVIDEGKYNKKADIWSLGCIIYELFTLNLYFYDKLFDRIKTINNEKYQKLINSLLQIDFNKRPDINQIINDYVDEGKINNNIINYDAINNNKIKNNTINNNIKDNNNINYKYTNKNHKKYEYIDNYKYSLKKPSGFKRIENHSYFISGLQIIASCEIIQKILIDRRYIRSDLISLLNDIFVQLNDSLTPIDCSNLCKYLTHNGILNKYNIEGDSQTFIESLIKNINEHIEINFLSIFSLKSEIYIFGNCQYCNKKINKNDISSDIIQKIKFDNIKQYISIIELMLRSQKEMPCPFCEKTIRLYKEIHPIELPEILIFTIEKINFKNFFVQIEIMIEKVRYQLFAINIKFEENPEKIYYICQVKREGKWYEINNEFVESINGPGEKHNNRICGLFYKKKSYI